MKAILLEGYGSVDHLLYEDVPIPVVGSDEVLVKVLATSVNPIDYKLRRGDLKDAMPLTFPAILGRDLTGRVMALGKDVTGLDVNELVMGLANKTYAEYVTCKADILTLVPQGLDAGQAGVLPLVVTTGAQLIEKGIGPADGQRILVTGAMGSVGRTAVHVAKQHGAYVIAGVRAQQRVQAETLGADKIVAVDEQDASQALGKLDAIADTVGGNLIGKLLPCLKKGGVLATVVGKPEAAAGYDLQINEVYAQPDAQRLALLAADVRRGELKIPISKRMRFAEIRLAHELAEKGVDGKILLTP